ncbi:hypothetical protein [Nocardioides pelophilus]|uniref:hypothetical protein n=1 Tax=Nocardioides pelophilus TaxID=2172019 RepID=UPI0016044B2C|nr:hypothetical protein [Nocardioides pelophilus]
MLVLNDDDGGGLPTVAEMDAVTFDDPGGPPPDAWADSMKAWLRIGDDSECRIGSVHDFTQGPRTDEFGPGFDYVLLDGAEGDEPLRAFYTVPVRGEEDRRAFALSLELFVDVDAALAEWDASVSGDNDEGERLEYRRRSDPQPFLGGQAWVDCWLGFDRPDGDRNCDAFFFYDGGCCRVNCREAWTPTRPRRRPRTGSLRHSPGWSARKVDRSGCDRWGAL